MYRCAPLATAAVLVLSACQPASEPQSALSLLPDVAGVGSAEPHLARSSDAVILSWLEHGTDGAALRYSRLIANEWSPPVTVAAGNDWFVNWADFPSVVPIRGKLWATHWLVKKAGSPYAYDIALAISNDGGQTWSEPNTPHDDGTPTEHGFVTLFDAGGNVGVLWLDGRHTGDGHGDGGMTLRSAHYSPGGEKIYEHVVDDLVCDCCQTDVAVAETRPVAIYRNRTNGEIRDIYAARFTGDEWQAGARVADDGWEIAGCPVNGPALDASGSRLAAAWFTAANDEPRVRFAFSLDGGSSFLPATDIDAKGSIGRVDTELLPDGAALISWLRKAENSTAQVVVRHIAADGVTGPATVIATTGAGRLSGFPQMLVSNDKVVFAWTDTAGDAPQVRTAIVNVAELTTH